MAIISAQNKRPLVVVTPLHQQEQAAKKRKLSLEGNSLFNPKGFVEMAFQANGVNVETIPDIARNRYLSPKPELVNAYTMETSTAVRTNDVQKLKELYVSGALLDCCNRFGDSLLHIACRRGNTETVKFLVNEANVSVRFVDDLNRTPLHDACWTSEPNFEIVEILLRAAPEHALCQDKRGHTPFDYARKGHWGQWIEFLNERQGFFTI